MNNSDTAANPRSDEEMVTLLKGVEGLVVENGLRTLGNSVTIYLKILRSFLKMTENDKGVMEGYIEQGDLGSFRIAVHGYKGVLANIGAVSLSELAGKLEKAAIDGDMEAINVQLLPFDEKLYEFADSIKGILQN